MNIDPNILNKLLATSTQQIERIMLCDQVGIISEMQRFFNTQIQQYDTPHQPIKRSKPYDHLNRCRKSF